LRPVCSRYTQLRTPISNPDRRSWAINISICSERRSRILISVSAPASQHKQPSKNHQARHLRVGCTCSLHYMRVAARLMAEQQQACILLHTERDFLVMQRMIILWFSFHHLSVKHQIGYTLVQFSSPFCKTPDRLVFPLSKRKSSLRHLSLAPHYLPPRVSIIL